MIQGLIVAFQFLTRLPVNIPVEFNSKNIAKSTLFFPLVGMVVGGLTALIIYVMSFFGQDIGAIGGVVALIVITGGLHIDGLSDTCDGFFSARDREKILEIMKDSRSGTFGVIAVVLDLLIKFVLISKIKTNLFPCLIFSCANARLTSVMIMTYTKCARPNGMGSMFSQSGTKKYFSVGSILYIIFICIFNVKFIIPLIISLLASLLIVMKSYKTIGGLTGDVYGANIEICEIVSIASFIAINLWI